MRLINNLFGKKFTFIARVAFSRFLCAGSIHIFETRIKQALLATKGLDQLRMYTDMAFNDGVDLFTKIVHLLRQTIPDCQL